MSRNLSFELSDSEESLTEIPCEIPKATKRLSPLPPPECPTKAKKPRLAAKKGKTLTVLLRQFLSTSIRLNVLHAVLNLIDARINDNPTADEKHLIPVWACLRKLIRLNAEPQIPDAQPLDPEYSPLLTPLPPSDKDLSEFDSSVVFYTMSCPNKMADQLTTLWNQYSVVAEEQITASLSLPSTATTSTSVMTAPCLVEGAAAPSFPVCQSSSIDSELGALLRSIQTTSSIQFSICTQENDESYTLKSAPVTAHTIYQFSEFPYTAIQDVARNNWWRFATKRILIGSAEKDDLLEKAGKAFVHTAIRRMYQAPNVTRERRNV